MPIFAEHSTDRVIAGRKLQDDGEPNLISNRIQFSPVHDGLRWWSRNLVGQAKGMQLPLVMQSVHRLIGRQQYFRQGGQFVLVLRQQQRFLERREQQVIALSLQFIPDCRQIAGGVCLERWQSQFA